MVVAQQSVLAPSTVGDAYASPCENDAYPQFGVQSSSVGGTDRLWSVSSGGSLALEPQERLNVFPIALSDAAHPREP